MSTIVGTIDVLIEILQKAKEEGFKYYIASNSLNGQQQAPSKKSGVFRLSFGFLAKAFNHEDLGKLLKDTSQLSIEAIQLIKEEIEQKGLEGYELD